MSEQKYRLVTRGDFDGVVSGALLLERDLINEIVFAEPKDIQAGYFDVGPNDILTNLPYVEAAHLCIDHHASEVKRVGDNDNLIIDPDAPSAARVVYNHFGGAAAFPEISLEMMDAVDQADAAQYSEEEILAPNPWILLNFILDPRSGVDRIGSFAISREQFMKDVMIYCRRHPIDEILRIPDVEERLHLYTKHEEYFERQLKRCSSVHGKLLVCDMRGEKELFVGNRFMLYAIYPQCNISIQVIPEENGTQTLLAVGKSLLDRTSQVDVGLLMLEYGGGGHKQVGSCRVANEQVDDVLAALVDVITADA